MSSNFSAQPRAATRSARPILATNASRADMSSSALPISNPAARMHRDCGQCELRSLRMFCNLNDSALTDFNSIGVKGTLPRGATIFHEDEPSGGVLSSAPDR